MKNKILEEITDIIVAEGSVTTNSLSRRLGITEKTVRLYLSELERNEILVRTFGGAVRVQKQANDTFPENIDIYRQRNVINKRDIAHEALSLIKENDVIFLDDGSTVLELAKLLGRFPITVLTHDVMIFYELMNKEKIDLHIVGGRLRRDAVSPFIEGNEAEDYIKTKHADICFLGISTIDFTNNTLNIFQYGNKDIKKAYISNAEKTIVMADSGKFGKSAFTSIANLSDIDMVITDSDLDEKYKVYFKDKVPSLTIAKQYNY